MLSEVVLIYSNYQQQTWLMVLLSGQPLSQMTISVHVVVGQINNTQPSCVAGWHKQSERNCTAGCSCVFHDPLLTLLTLTNHESLVAHGQTNITQETTDALISGSVIYLLHFNTTFRVVIFWINQTFVIWNLHDRGAFMKTQCKKSCTKKIAKGSATENLLGSVLEGYRKIFILTFTKKNVEDEKHLVSCPVYQEKRKSLFLKMLTERVQNPN